MKSKKDIIKNILIVFLVVLLLLTFFSNTILNHSLAEVSVSWISNGSINTAVRGSGVVTSVDPYSVTISEGRKITAIKVKNGANVKKGDVLFELKEAESTELTDAINTVAELKQEFDSYVIENMISSDIVNAAKNGETESLQNKMASLTGMVDVINTKQNTIDSFARQLLVYGASYVDTSSEEAKLAAINALISIENKVIAIQAEASAAEDIAPYITKITELDSQKKQYFIKYPEFQGKSLDEWNTISEDLTKIVNEKKNNPFASEITQITYQKTLAETELEVIKNQYNDLNLEVKNQMALSNMLDKIAEAEATVTRIQNKSLGDTVVAPISGTVTDIQVYSGETTSKGDTLCSIVPTGSEYKMQITVSKEQAVRIKVGDKATLASSWYYQDVDLTVAQIKNDATNPSSGNKIVTFTVTGGDVSPNQSLSIIVGEKSVNYDMIVPNTAIREDSNGTYVLIVTSKNTPLGNRYTATRVDVKKLASDENNTAISADSISYESVITTANKPVAAGDQVRLAD